MAQPRRRPGRPPSSALRTPTAKRILEVAAQLFIEYGYEGVSTDTVAERCGLTKAAVYYHYSSKAELFTAAMVNMMNNIRQRTLDLLQGEEPLRNRLLQIARIRLRIPHTQSDMNVLMRRAEVAVSEEQMEEMRLAERQMTAGLVDAFAAAREKGEIRNVDPAFAAHAYVSLLNLGVSRDHHPALQAISVEEMAEEVIALLWQGIGP